MDDLDRGTLEKRILEQAEQMVERRTTAVELSNRIFGPNGMLRALWTTQAERKALLGSVLYCTLKSHLRALERFDVVQFERDVEEHSGLRGQKQGDATRSEPEAA